MTITKLYDILTFSLILAFLITNPYPIGGFYGISFAQLDVETQANTESSSNSSQLLTYRNPSFGIELKYPKEWTFESGADILDKNIYSLGQATSSTLAKFSPVELYEKNDFVLVLQYFNLIGGLSVEELVQGQIDQSKDWNVVNHMNDTVDENPAVRVVLSNNQTVGSEQRKSAIYTVVNSKGYGLIYQTAYPEPYLNYERVAQAILGSIKLGVEKTSGDTLSSIFDGNLYENPTYGIKIGYPKQWTYENQDLDIDRAIYHAGDVDGQSTIVEFTPPGVTNTSYFSLDITFYNLPSGISLEKFVQDEIDDFSSWTVIDRSEVTVSNHRAERVISTQSGDTTDFRRMALYSVFNGKGYSIDYSNSYPSTYQQYITDIMNMMESFSVSGLTSLDKPIEWAIFEDGNLGISLEYPVGWEVERKENKFDEGPEVTITDNSDEGTGEIKIAGIVRLQSSLYDAELAALQVQNVLTEEEDTHIIENVDMDKYKIAGKEAGTFLYTSPSPLAELFSGISQSSSPLSDIFTPDDYAQQVVVTIHDKKIYTVAFSATTGDFEGYNDIIDHIFTSVKFIK